MTKEAILQKLLDDAARVRCCRNCRFSYMRFDEHKGLCKITTLPVDEDHVCRRWINKDIQIIDDKEEDNGSGI
jgi:hypothetical protein